MIGDNAGLGSQMTSGHNRMSDYFPIPLCPSQIRLLNPCILISTRQEYTQRVETWTGKEGAAFWTKLNNDSRLQRRNILVHQPMIISDYF